MRTPGGTAAAREGLPAALVGMLAATMLINYADRGSLSVAAPALTARLHLGGAQMGVLLSAFFWSYGLAQPLAGAIAQRFDVRRVMAGALALWAIATALCGLATGFASLLALRMLVGLGESVIYPVCAKVLSRRGGERQRGLANGVILLGQFLGPTTGALAGGLILARYGWSAMFFVLGGVSLLWVIPWLSLRLDPTPDAAEPPEPPPAYAVILRRPALWSVSAGHFCYAYTHYLLLTWLPLYLVQGLHHSLVRMSVVGGAIFAVQGFGALAGGWLCDRTIAAGVPAPAVRKGAMLISLAGLMAGMGLVGLLPPGRAAPLLCVVGLCNGAASGLVFNIGQTFAGPTAGARWMGIQNTAGQIAGISAPILTGVLLQRTGGFATAFLLAAAVTAVGLAVWAFLIPRIAPQAWPALPSARGLSPVRLGLRTGGPS